MIFDDEDDKRPAVLSAKNCVQSFAVHVVLFAILGLVAWINFTPREKEEEIHFFDPTFEAPPDEVAPEPEPEPPKPEPEPVKQPDPPPVIAEDEDAIEKIKKPEKKVEEKKPEKKVEEKKPEKPKKPEKTKEQIKKERDEKLRKMREGAKVVKNPNPPPVAGTGKKLDPNWKELLKQGYKPSDHTELAPNVEALCYSLIRNAFYDQWDRPPWTDTLREMVLRVWFGPGGRVVNYKLEKSSGDPKADATVINAARAVRVVSGLALDFINAKKSAGVPIRFKVTPQ